MRTHGTPLSGGYLEELSAGVPVFSIGEHCERTKSHTIVHNSAETRELATHKKLRSLVLFGVENFNYNNKRAMTVRGTAIVGRDEC